jgi:hypothetical protein
MKISNTYTQEELVRYLKYDKNKASVHNIILDKKKYDEKILKSSILSYYDRVDIVEYILRDNYHFKCAW